MKQTFVILFIAAGFLIASCHKNLSDLNTNPKAAAEVPGNTLFSNAQKNFADILTTPNVNNNVFEFITQYWAATTYPQESRYDLGNRNIPQNWWTIIYRDVIRDLDESIRLIRSEDAITDVQKTVQANRVAIARITWVHAYYTLVTTFGNIPYTEAMNVENPTPVYDDQKTIYYALLDSLDASLGQLDNTQEGFGSADLVYNGNIDQWVKYGNSLKLRMALLIADYDAGKAATLVAEAAPNVFTSNADNAVFQYLTTPPNTNPIWTNLVQSNRNDYVPANTLINVMNTLNDPRRDDYFTLGPGGNYSGGIYGAGNTFGNFSHVSDAVLAPDFPTSFLDYSEVEFLLAEAAARGFSVGGTAAQHYTNAVTASIEYWGGTPAEAATYLANPAVNYATAAGTWQQKIGTQAWIALYLRSFDEWVEWRKLNYPLLVKPASAITDIPIRYTYPSNEQNLNETNYDEASQAIGGDKVTTGLFWDVN